MELQSVERFGSKNSNKPKDNGDLDLTNPKNFPTLITRLADLPTELLVKIYDQLTPENISRLSLVNRHLLSVFYIAALIRNDPEICRRIKDSLGQLNVVKREYILWKNGSPEQWTPEQRFSFPEVRLDPYTTMDRRGLGYLKDAKLSRLYIPIIKYGVRTVEELKKLEETIKARKPQFFSNHNYLEIAVYFEAIGVDSKTFSRDDYTIYKDDWIKKIFSKIWK